jgi:hypothetical protein
VDPCTNLAVVGRDGVVGDRQRLPATVTKKDRSFSGCLLSLDIAPLVSSVKAARQKLAIGLHHSSRDLNLPLYGNYKL